MTYRCQKCGTEFELPDKFSVPMLMWCDPCLGIPVAT